MLYDVSVLLIANVELSGLVSSQASGPASIITESGKWHVPQCPITDDQRALVLLTPGICMNGATRPTHVSRFPITGQTRPTGNKLQLITVTN